MTEPEARGFTLKAWREGYVPPPAPVPGLQLPAAVPEPLPAPPEPAQVPTRLPEPPDGSVITFTKRWSNSRSYTYVAFNADGYWFCTARPGSEHWYTLMVFIDQGQAEPPEIHLATEWEEWTNEPG